MAVGHINEVAVLTNNVIIKCNGVLPAQKSDRIIEVTVLTGWP